MTEFTKDIQTLTQQASASPQLQTNTGSLATDLVSAASFGLGLYRQNKAATALAGAKQQQADYQTKVSEGIMKFRNLRISLKDQEINGITVARKESEFFKKEGGGAEYAQAVISGANKLTGTNTLDMMSAKDKEVQANFDAYQEQQVEGQGFASSVLGIPPEKLSAASPEQNQAWAEESKVFRAEVAGYEAAQSVGENVTQSFLLPAMAVNRQRMDGLLANIQDKWTTGDSVRAEELTLAFNSEVNQMIDGAQDYVRSQMDGKGKGAFYDGSLVSAYVSKLGSRLNSPAVQDVLSGKKTDTNATNKAKARIATTFSDHFLKITDKVEKGTATEEDINDYENYVGYYISKDITGLSVTGSNFGATLSRASGGKSPPPPPKVKVTDKAMTLVDIVNSAYAFVKGNDAEEIKKNQGDISSVIETSLKEERPVSEKNVAWMFDSLKIGVNDTTDMKGKGASKALLEGPLKILTHPDYKTKLAPLVEAYADKGVDVTQVVSQSLDNHIRNNFYNAFINLATSATTPYSAGTSIGIDKNKPSISAISGRSTYNLKDDVEIKTTANGIMFSWKKDVTGANTDTGRIKNLQRLNNSTKTINQYLTALSNVSGTDKQEWSNSLKSELDSMFGLGEVSDASVNSTPKDMIRADGTKKSTGYFGTLKTTDGTKRDMTEFSVGVEFEDGEKELPTLVPTLTKEELSYLLSGNDPTQAIVDKAIEHGLGRMKEGRSPFWEEGDKVEKRP